MPQPTRWRLDAIVLTLLAVGSVLAVAVATYAPLFGQSNLLGERGDGLAKLVVDPLGWSALVFLAGWFVIALRLVVSRHPGKLVLRATGWAILTLCAAIAADGLGAKLPSASVAGRGGTIGAFLHYQLEDRVDPWLEWSLFAIAASLGMLLAADRFVKLIVRLEGRLLRLIGKAAVHGNDRVALLNERLLDASGRAARGTVDFLKNRIPARTTGKSSATPAVTSHPTPAVIAFPKLRRETPSEAVTPDTIPITRPEDILESEGGRGDADGLPVLRAILPEDEPAPDRNYELPPLTLLNDPEPFPVADHEQKLRDMAALLEKTFLDFGLSVKVVGIHTGPVITQYEISLETGLRLNKVTNLADDLALNLRVSAVRVVAPLPGRNTVGIEVPNEIRQSVRLKELITGTTTKAAKFKLPIFLGKDVEGRPLVYDLASMPHLLIAGRTGTGKSVCLNSIILSLLFAKTPDECRMILIDPKKVELTEYATIPHLMTPVVKEDKKSEAILAWAVDKMEERYEWLHRARVRNIASYNELPFEEVVRRINPDSEEERKSIPRKMPYIVIIIDEVADLIMKMRKEIEGNIILLAQKSRAAGIHLILATQKPTVDVVTGLIKSNLPARICFQVASRSDSAVVLDEKGAEKLLGMGDMLFLQPGTSTIIRAQGAYVEDKEIERVVNELSTDTPNYDSELLNLKTKDQAGDGGNATGAKLRERDPLYEQAVEIIIREQRGSTSLLQRALGIGYGKASRFIDFMAEDGLVGAYNGSNARDVLVTTEEWETKRNAG